MAYTDIFLTNKIKKKRIKSKKYADISAVSWENKRPTWKINITKMGEMLKSEKFMIIFAKIWTEK